MNARSHFQVYYTQPNIGDVFQDVLLPLTVTGDTQWLPIIPPPPKANKRLTEAMWWVKGSYDDQ